MRLPIVICLMLFTTLAKGKSDLVSFSFQQVKVAAVLQMLADIKELNLVVTEDVTESISIELKDVPWPQALTVILKSNNLTSEQIGNVLVISKRLSAAGHQQQLMEQSQKIEQLAPLFTEVIPVLYADVQEIYQGLSANKQSLLSKRGHISQDIRNNALLVRDTKEYLSQLKELLKQLDKPATQIEIEARMVTIRDNVGDQLGIRWGFSGAMDNEQGNIATAGNIANFSEQAANYNINLPVAAPAGSIAFRFAEFDNNRLLDLELTALARENKGEIIATPKILATNKQLSVIEQGTEIPYVESAASGATSVSFKKAVLSLQVTPHVTPGDNIILDLKITQDARGDTVITSTGPAVAIDTQAISTRVSVANGKTIVLGGIYHQQLIKTVKKVPLLADIPGLGWLFSSQSNIHEKRELLIFVTPRIVSTG